MGNQFARIASEGPERDLNTSRSASLSTPLIRKHDCGAFWEGHVGVNMGGVFNNFCLLMCSVLCSTIGHHYIVCTRLTKIIVCLV